MHMSRIKQVAKLLNSMYKIEFSDNHLSHHGILGQKWGQRNGPPYPLNYKDYSSSEKQHVTSKQAEKNKEYLVSKVKNYISETDLSDLNAASKKFTDLAGEMATENASFFKEAIGNTAIKNAVFKELRNDFGNGCDDEEYFDDEKEFAIARALLNSRPDRIKSKEAEMWRAGNKYYEICESISNDLIKEYGSLVVSNDLRDVNYQAGRNTTGSEIIKNLVLSNMKDSAFNSYIFRHYDDYWVHDLKELDDYCKTIKMDDYNEWAKRH